MKIKFHLLFIFFLAGTTFAEIPDCMKYGYFFCGKSMRDKIEFLNRGGEAIPQELIAHKDILMPGEKGTFIERTAPLGYGQTPEEDPETRMSLRASEIRAGLNEYLSLKNALNIGSLTDLTPETEVSLLCKSAECRYFAENPNSRQNSFLYDRGNADYMDRLEVYEAEMGEMLKWMHPLLNAAIAANAGKDLNEIEAISPPISISLPIDDSFSLSQLWEIIKHPGKVDDMVGDKVEAAVNQELASEDNSFAGLYMAGQRQDQPFSDYNYCGIPEMVGVCAHLSQFNIPFVSWLCEADQNKGANNEIYWGYRVPFQKIETMRQPFATAYLSKEMMDVILPISKAVYAGLVKTSLKIQFEELTQKSLFKDLFYKSTCLPEKMSESQCAAAFTTFSKDLQNLTEVLPIKSNPYGRYRELFCFPHEVEDSACYQQYLEIEAHARASLSWESFRNDPIVPKTDTVFLETEFKNMYYMITTAWGKGQIRAENWKNHEYDNIAFIEALINDSNKFFMRDPNRSSVVNTEFRVVDTWLHQEAKTLSIFNSFNVYGTWSTPYNWLHCGAPLSACKEKLNVGLWYSDMPGTILNSKFRWPNYPYYQEEMFPPESKGTCRSNYYARDYKPEWVAFLKTQGLRDPGSTISKKVPTDILNPCLANNAEEQAKCNSDLARQRALLDAQDTNNKCIPHTPHGEKFDALSRVKAKYTFDGALVAVYRGLRDALTRGKEYGQMFHDVQWSEEGTPMTPTFRPRDYLQFMGQAGKKFPGCYASKPPDHPYFIPFHNGPIYEARPAEKDQNFNNWDEEINERYTFAHWRYLQACPPTKIKIFGIGIESSMSCYVPVGIWAKGVPYILE